VAGKQMLRVGVGALKAAGLRAVVSRGWAKLSEELLEAAVAEGDEDELCSYARENVLFIDKAPHEWLFPRCVCTVHHGGAGTTAASLRAGIPTVITPIVYDQFEHARWVTQLGSGIGLQDLEYVEVKELADALKKATGSPEMRARAKEVAELLKQEDGAQGAVDAVSGIIRNQVRNGWAKKKWQAEKEKDAEDLEKWRKLEMQRRAERRRALQRQKEPDYPRQKALFGDGKWLVWNTVWAAANSDLAEAHAGEAREEYQEKAAADTERATKHLDSLKSVDAWRVASLERLQEQADVAGRAVAASVQNGIVLDRADVRLLDAPSDFTDELWGQMVKAVRLAAVAVCEGCLDAHFLRKGNERWYMTPENYAECKHNKKSDEYLAQFEVAWGEHVAPDPDASLEKEPEKKEPGFKSYTFA